MKAILRLLSIVVIVPFVLQAAEDPAPLPMLSMAEYTPPQRVLALVDKPQGFVYQVVEILQGWHNDNNLNRADFDYILKNAKTKCGSLLHEAAGAVYYMDENSLAPLIELIHKVGLPIEEYINTSDAYGRTPLAFAARINKARALLLLDNGANPNARFTSYYSMPAGATIPALHSDIPVLHVAVWRGWHDVVEKLIESGAHINVPCSMSTLYEMPNEKYRSMPQKTPLDVAIDCATELRDNRDAHTTKTWIMRFLIANGAKTYNEFARELSEKDAERQVELEVPESQDCQEDMQEE